jgi:hypothetical protein
MKQLVPLLLLVCCSCSKQPNLFLGEMRIVSSFEQEQHLPGTLVEGIDSIGVSDIYFFKEYKLLSVYDFPYFIRVYKGDMNQFMGDSFHKGKGPNEYVRLRIVKQQMDSLLIVHDANQRKVFLIDFIDNGSNIRAERVKEIKYDGFWDPLQAFYLNDSLLLVKNVAVRNKEYSIVYSFYNYKQDTIFENIPIYRESLRYREMNRIYTLADALKPDKTKIVSVTGTFNQIDILDLRNPVRSLSVSIGKENLTLEELKRYANSNTQERLHRYYASRPICNDKYIVTLYQSKQSDKQEIHVMSWKGEALYCFSIDESLDVMNIDWKNAKLYGITEEGFIYSYDLTGLGLV